MGQARRHRTPPAQERSVEWHGRVKDLLFDALDRPEAEWGEFLDRACAGDVGLRDEVLDLLARQRETDGFLAGHARLERAALAGAQGDPAPALPEELAGYRILGLLGHGGMGVVYLAQQQRPRREVALKLLRFDRPEPSVRRRFEREAELQGRLEHPCIARIYEAGVAATETGARFYIAMERVEGEGLLAHAERLPGLAQRVELVARVADAIDYAHGAGVLHRDIKPENLLVEAGGAPKVLDFGVARALDQEATRQTLTGQIVGTLAYMSPEQIRGEPATMASDQFSLGVVLFQVVTGHLPFEPLRRGGRTGSDDTPQMGWLRRSGELPRDLATILLKAIDPAPERRYSSVAKLAADLRRFLDGAPIEARPATTLYQLGKLVRRHRWGAAALLITFLSLTLGLGFTLVAMRDAQASEARAVSSEANLLRLADEQRVLNLETRAGGLWPIAEATLPALEAWLSDLHELVDRLPQHRRDLERLRARRAANVVVPELSDELERAISSLEAIASGLGALLESGGLGNEIEARAQFVRGLRTWTVDARREAWAQALAHAASPAGPYRGLHLVPEPGLVPLGADPVSGLLEFALVCTGEVPVRDRCGRLGIGEGTALVLVLIPGGPAWIGAQCSDPSGRHFDLLAWQEGVGPPRLLSHLDPFLISKFETTQGQWRRIMGTQPSDRSAGEVQGRVVFSLLHPVESIDRAAALEFCRRVGAGLPTEVRWEVAARAGTHTPWWHGADVSCVQGRTNLKEEGPRPNDGWKFHAPVGSFEPNPYGLHDMAGNVSELCLDHFKVDLHTVPLDPGTGRVLVDGDGDWSVRGGSFMTPPRVARSAARQNCRAESGQAQTGMRVVREVRRRL